jgi:hypothetical protein
MSEHATRYLRGSERRAATEHLKDEMADVIVGCVSMGAGIVAWALWRSYRSIRGDVARLLEGGAPRSRSRPTSKRPS